VLAEYLTVAVAGMGLEVAVGVASVNVPVGVGGVINSGGNVHVGALVRLGDGWIVDVGVQVASCGMRVTVGVGDWYAVGEGTGRKGLMNEFGIKYRARK